MTYLLFPSGDLELVTIIKHQGDQVCVQMPFGPFWTDAKRLVMLGD